MIAAVVIPARLGSTRFPGKLLAAQTGQPLVQHVVDRVRLCRRVGRVIVAAAEQQIVDALKPFGTQCVLTNPDHPSGTDRVAEVAASLQEEIIVNVQGDEPEIDPQLVDRLVECLVGEDGASMATASGPFSAEADPSDPNLVKVVTDGQGYALYFSRALIPFAREAGSGNVAPQLHIGIYAYRRRFLLQYAGWPVSRLERTEKLEQLRVLERGEKILVLEAAAAWHGIDTAEQYAQFVQRVRARGLGGAGGPAGH